MPPLWRRLAAAALVVVLGGTAVAVLWWQDWRYSLPTPVPPELHQPEIGSPLLAQPFAAPLRALAGGRPLLVHVFNPDCPCSRFNTEHVQALVRAHGDAVAFAVLLQGADARGADGEFAGQRPLPIVHDKDGAIAAALGVYATPQAVLFSADGRLYFRGNYNASRFCVDRRSEYARLALESLLAGAPPPRLPPAATVAYGCALPEREEPHASR